MQLNALLLGRVDSLALMQRKGFCKEGLSWRVFKSSFGRVTKLYSIGPSVLYQVAYAVLQEPVRFHPRQDLLAAHLALPHG